MYVIQSEFRDQLAQYLIDNGVANAIHYPIPDYSQQIEREYGQFSLATTEALCNSILTIPCHPELSQDEILKIIRLLNNFTL